MVDVNTQAVIPIVFFLVGSLCGLLLEATTHMAGATWMLAGILCLVGYIATYIMMPRIARIFWNAEQQGNIVGFIHGNDFRVFPVEMEYRSGMLVPVDKRLRDTVRYIPEPNSTIPIVNGRSKVAWIYIDYPFALSPEYITLVYEFKRQGYDTLDELMLADKYYESIEELEQRLREREEELKRIENGELPEEIKRALEKGEIDEKDILERTMKLRNEIEKIKRVLAKLKEEGVNKPVALLRGRVYTVNDVLGYLGYRLPHNQLKSIVEHKVVETMQRMKLLGKDYMKTAALAATIIIVASIIALIVFLVGMQYIHPGTTTMPQPPVQLPTPTPLNSTGG